MALDFIVRDVIHKITAKFTHAYLPDAKKPYNLRAVFQPEIDIHGIASKAEVYNIETSPKVIEEGFNAACELIYYLTADGYKIKTPVFNLRMRLPGEYEGAETHLAEGAFPEVRLQAAAAFRTYIKDTVKVDFDGIEDRDGLIAEALDEKTGLIDEAATLGNLLVIRGYGLKIESDAAHAAQVGVFFEGGPNTPVSVKADILAVNEPRTLKVIVPPTLSVGYPHTLRVVTMSSPHKSAYLLKAPREMRSDFQLIPQA
jgi:hypothetical protein